MDDLNFERDLYEAKWLEKFDELKDCHNKNNHTRVTKYDCANKSLIKWVAEQRRRCYMESRTKLLDYIEFIWSGPEKKQWIEKCNELKDFC